MADKNTNKITTRDPLPAQADGRIWIQETLPNSYMHPETGHYAFMLYDADSFDGNLSNTIGKLTTVQQHYTKKGYREITLDLLNALYVPHELTIVLKGFRVETTSEQQDRIAREEAKRDNKQECKRRHEEKELREYKRLKKKFEST